MTNLELENLITRNFPCNFCKAVNSLELVSNSTVGWPIAARYIVLECKNCGSNTNHNRAKLEYLISGGTKRFNVK